MFFAHVTYSHASMGSAIDEFVATFTHDYYQRSMQTLEKALNHYLTIGELLPDDHAA